MRDSTGTPLTGSTAFERLLRGEITSAEYVAGLRAIAAANVAALRKRTGT